MIKKTKSKKKSNKKSKKIDEFHFPILVMNRGPSEDELPKVTNEEYYQHWYTTEIEKLDNILNSITTPQVIAAINQIQLLLDIRFKALEEGIGLKQNSNIALGLTAKMPGYETGVGHYYSLFINGIYIENILLSATTTEQMMEEVKKRIYKKHESGTITSMSITSPDNNNADRKVYVTIK